MCHDVWYSDITANMETFKLTETASLIIRSECTCVVNTTVQAHITIWIMYPLNSRKNITPLTLDKLSGFLVPQDSNRPSMCMITLHFKTNMPGGKQRGGSVFAIYTTWAHENFVLHPCIQVLSLIFHNRFYWCTFNVVRVCCRSADDVFPALMLTGVG